MKPLNLIVAAAIISGAGAIMTQSKAKKITVREGPGNSKFIAIQNGSSGSGQRDLPQSTP